MTHRNISALALLVAAVFVPATHAVVAHHLMQIEQVIGGVNGDTTAQAIQLQMRASGQNQVQLGKIMAFDAAGLNPVVIIDFASSVPASGAGVKVLVASPNFSSVTAPAAVPDFTMTNLIPASYLAGGSLVFENDAGSSIWFRLSWGGGGYTGSNAGSVTNDDDGDFGPPFGSALPSGDAQAVLFQGAPADLHTTNAADFALTGSAAVFTNNAGASFTVQAAPCAGFVCADANCSGAVDSEDIDPFFVALGNAATYAKQFPACDLICNCDANDSGGVDSEDIDPFFVALGLGGCP